jgi:hypothetical protein
MRWNAVALYASLAATSCHNRPEGLMSLSTNRRTATSLSPPTNGTVTMSVSKAIHPTYVSKTQMSAA